MVIVFNDFLLTINANCVGVSDLGNSSCQLTGTIPDMIISSGRLMN